MVIRTVDHSDAHIFTGELLRRLKSTKSRSDDHYARLFRQRVLHTQECSQKENRCEDLLRSRRYDTYGAERLNTRAPPDPIRPSSQGYEVAGRRLHEREL